MVLLDVWRSLIDLMRKYNFSSSGILGEISSGKEIGETVQKSGHLSQRRRLDGQTLMMVLSSCVLKI